MGGGLFGERYVTVGGCVWVSVTKRYDGVGGGVEFTAKKRYVTLEWPLTHSYDNAHTTSSKTKKPLL